MAVTTITEPSADVRQETIFNKLMKANKTFWLDQAEKASVWLLRLHPDVSPTDYAKLRNGINAVQGIRAIELLIDAPPTPGSVAEGKQVVVAMDVNVRQRVDYGRYVRTGRLLPLGLSEKVAMCVLRLHAAVEVTHYAAQQAAVEAVQGIQELELLVNHQVLGSVVEDAGAMVAVTADMRIHDTPEPPG